MSNEGTPRTISRRRREPAHLFAEALAVVVVGLAVALLANQLSPRGLRLGRDYFPTTNAKPPHPEPSADALLARLQAVGLRWIGRAEAMELFEDPRREQELIVFVDARNEQHYQNGHIPGAYLFDRYYPETHLPIILPACQQAERVVVYCNGGDCEDSEFAALALRDAGIPTERLGVFGGGMTDWSAQNLPVEVGDRGSGELRQGAP